MLAVFNKRNSHVHIVTSTATIGIRGTGSMSAQGHTNFTLALVMVKLICAWDATLSRLALHITMLTMFQKGRSPRGSGARGVRDQREHDGASRRDEAAKGVP